MDEKGFLIGLLNETKRVVSVQSLKQEMMNGAGQDGNRSWITTIASVSCDGTYLPPSLIFQGQGNLQTSWLRKFEPGKHTCYFASSPNGWTCDDLGLDWLTKVFDRHTKKKARNGRDWRLLWVDGHNSHVNIRFLDACHARKILVAVYPPHATHRLQPLDVSIFRPLSIFYSQNLDRWMQTTRGTLQLGQQDFYGLFWPAFQKAFTEKNILSGWLKSGLHPFEPEVVLKKVDLQHHNESPERPNNTHSPASTLTPSDWRKTRAIIRTARDPVTRKLARGFARVAAQNSLLEHRILHLEQTIQIQKRRAPRSKPLFDQLRADGESKALFFSPAKIAAAHTLLEEKEAKEQAEIERKAQKAIEQKLNKARKEKEKEERKIVREIARQQKEAEKAQKAIQQQELKRQRELKKQAAIEAKLAKKKAPRKPKAPVKSNCKKQVSNGVISGRVVKAARATRTRNPKVPQRFQT